MVTLEILFSIATLVAMIGKKTKNLSRSLLSLQESFGAK
jgi:hypothetical protein